MGTEGGQGAGQSQQPLRVGVLRLTCGSGQQGHCGAGRDAVGSGWARSQMLAVKPGPGVPAFSASEIQGERKAL